MFNESRDVPFVNSDVNASCKNFRILIVDKKYRIIKRNQNELCFYCNFWLKKFLFESKLFSRWFAGNWVLTKSTKISVLAIIFGTVPDRLWNFYMILFMTIKSHKFQREFGYIRWPNGTSNALKGVRHILNPNFRGNRLFRILLIKKAMFVFRNV